ncbi:MAG: hypothetical protein ABW185_10975 [Sedimenticola sp.]
MGNNDKSKFAAESFIRPTVVPIVESIPCAVLRECNLHFFQNSPRAVVHVEDVNWLHKRVCRRKAVLKDTPQPDVAHHTAKLSWFCQNCIALLFHASTNCFYLS